MSEWLCTRCRIGTPREHRVSTTRRRPTSKPAIAAPWFRAERRAATHFPAQCPLPIIAPAATIAIIATVDVIATIISQIGTATPIRPRSCCPFETPPAAAPTMQKNNTSSHCPPYPNGPGPNLEERHSDQNTVRSNSDNANPEKLSNVEHTDSNSVINGIISSPTNPATVRRLSQEKDAKNSTAVSWHKRVVVHRVPRSDASRSMFVSSSQSKEGLSSQCCVIV